MIAHTNTEYNKTCADIPIPDKADFKSIVLDKKGTFHSNSKFVKKIKSVLNIYAHNKRLPNT